MEDKISMNLNRRKFLGAAAMSPLAAKEMAEKAAQIAQTEAMNASGIELYGDSLYTGVTTYDPEPEMRSLWDAMKEIGIPDWKQDDLWEDAKRSRTLDPDIASMRSISLNSKMKMQWKRNYDQLVSRAFTQQKMEKLKQTFFKSNPDISEY
jgi:hypothetical protein